MLLSGELGGDRRTSLPALARQKTMQLKLAASCHFALPASFRASYSSYSCSSYLFLQYISNIFPIPVHASSTVAVKTID